jgi:tRNA(fMet)-specific endonuclease VapC
MGILYLLDTNILVHYVRHDALWQHIEATYFLLTTDPPPVISVVSAGELRSLAIQWNWQAARMNQMRFILNYFQKLSIDREQVHEAYATIDAETKSNGIPMTKNDLWIAATAHVFGATLLTTDRDFDAITPAFVRREWIDPNTP